ncbi:sulfotransferase [Fretibacter rubidus]|uniref:tetratricopeptide repeat-containing sulfotransferase family protein n=1 Tax=Fretibacter rubidus TaxID=570162 RepID=UPI00352B6535
MGPLTFASGTKLLGARNYKALYTEAIDALKRDEKNPLAFFFLGIVASDHGEKTKSLEFFAKAVELEPRQSRYQAYYAKALLGAGQLEATKAHIDIAAKRGTKDALISDMIGTIYSRLGDHATALPHFQKAVKFNPKWPVFHYNLAASAQFLGNIKLAKQAYLDCVKLDPKFYRAWFSLVSLESQTEARNHIPRLKSLFTSLKNNSSAQLMLGHSLAKTYEDLEDYTASLQWLHDAKALKRKEVRYDKSAIVKLFSTLKTASLINLSETGVEPSPTPVFIIGMPRTGTTLMDRILSSHPLVTSAGELNVIAPMVKAKLGMSSPTLLDVQTFTAGQQSTLDGVAGQYRDYIKTLASDAKYLIDKTPLNFLYVGLIHRLMPDAKFIVVRRGAMDSCLSNYRQLFAPEARDYDYSYDLADTADFYKHFDDLMGHWQTMLPPQAIMEMGYENMVLDQEQQTRRLLDFFDLPWDEACMNFHENKAAVDSASSVQVRKPLYSGSINRWKKYGHSLDALKAALGGLAD